MPDSIYLDEQDIRRMTGGKRKFSAQCRALERLRVRFTKADNGAPLVLRSYAEGKGGARAAAPDRGIDWASLQGAGKRSR